MLAGCAAAPRQDTDGYIVRPQDTLYSIAWRFGLDYHELARWNDIGADYRLRPGQRLRLRPGAPASGRSATASGGSASGGPPPAAGGSVVARPPDSGGGAVGVHWQWPTDRLGNPRSVPGGGILLFGHLGQDVRAAASGRVVYTGSGLRSYGELVIIRHGDYLLSAYAHNRELLVHEGQDVAAGQVIARMGEAAHQTVALYFEIRRNGKPVDPLAYLPVR